MWDPDYNAAMPHDLGVGALNKVIRLNDLLHVPSCVEQYHLHLSSQAEAPSESTLVCEGAQLPMVCVIDFNSP